MSDRNVAYYLEHGVIYQLFLRAFTPEGTLNAAAKLLPHIRKIGADVVYLCPCFVADDDPDVAGWSDRQRASGCNNPMNPYRIGDYFNVDPEYGTDDDLKSFIATAHSNGMRVILDLVYFHCGPSAVFLKNHPDFIQRGEDGKPLVGSWRFPRLNFENGELREYLIDNMEYLIRYFDADGFRCDVGDGVPLDFWAEAHDRIDILKSDIMMLNEGTKPDYIDVFDLNYNWSYRGAFIGCVTEGKPVSTLRDTVLNFSRDKLQGTFRSISLLENHDTVNDDYANRLEKRIGHDAMDAGFAINFTLPMVPFVYNGTEVCDENRHSIFGSRFHGANLTVGWQNALTEAGKERLKLIRSLSRLRHDVFALGMYSALDFNESGSDSVIAYTRTQQNERIAVIVNLSGETVVVRTDIKALEIEPLILRKAIASVSGTDGCVCARLEAYGFVIAELK